MGPLLLTGGGGFVGRALIARLASAGAPAVRLLSRGGATLDSSRLPSGWRVIQGDLEAIDRWAEALAGVETVVHLAALTGKAGRAAHQGVNLEATERLLEAARHAGVARFLFVSTIAAGYPDRSHYHYANAKAAAEAIVTAAAGIETIVVRPTMVFGAGSPVQANLARLARLPIPVTFGADRAVQPIHVDDLAELLAALLERKHWGNRTIEAGGPDLTTMDRLQDRLRQAAGLPIRSRLRVPIKPVRALLALLEPVALGLLPFSAGQLTAFANDTRAVAPPPDLELPLPSRHLDVMVGA